jgi:hypothetical protein
MILPPKNPVQGKFTYFDVLCANAQPYMPNTPLNFEGYNELVDAYVVLSDLDTHANYRMAVDFNAWFEYIANIANVVQNAYLDAETEKLQTVSTSSLNASEKSVAAGDRKANTDPEVIIARKKRNALKSLYDALIARQEFCEKAFYQCKYNCMESGERSGGNGARRRGGEYS